MFVKQKTAPQHPEEIVRQDLPHGAGWILRHGGMNISIEYKGGDLQISAARLNANGEETAALLLTVPSSERERFTSTLKSMGVRKGFVMGFDEACAIIEMVAHSAGVPCQPIIPELSNRPIDPAALQDLRDLSFNARNPADQLDRLTGMPGKALLLDSDSIRKLSERIPGDKVLAFLDFNNMGLANKCGLGLEVDKILGRLKDAGAKAFSGTPHQLVRLGGDEFAVVISGTAGSARVSIEKFRKVIQKIRDEEFYGKEAVLAQAEKRAERRAAMRGIMSTYKSESGIEEVDEKGRSPFQKAAFREWVARRIREHVPGFLPSREWTGKLVLQLAEHEMIVVREKNEQIIDPRVMTFSIGAVELGGDPTPKDIVKGLDLSEKEIHRQKELPRSTTNRAEAFLRVAPFNELASIILRDSERDEMAQQSITGARVKTARFELERLQHEAFEGDSELVRLRAKAELRRAISIDPSVAHDVLRYNLVKDLALNTLLIPGAQNIISAFTLDINHFGVINNQLGYARADALIARTAGMVRDVAPGALLVRKDGGKLVVLTSESLNNEDLQLLRHRTELALKECVNDRVLAEFQIRVAQQQWDTGTKGVHQLEAGIRRMRVLQADVVAIGSETVEAIIGDIERASTLVPRPRPAPREREVASVSYKR